MINVRRLQPQEEAAMFLPTASPLCVWATLMHPMAVKIMQLMTAPNRPTVFVNGKAAARVGDAIDCGGSSDSGSGTVNVDDNG